MKIIPNYDHTVSRAKSYPDVGDQLDAIYKTFLHLHTQGIDLGEDGVDWLKTIYTIKEGFPKPKE